MLNLDLIGAGRIATMEILGSEGMVVTDQQLRQPYPANTVA